MKVRRCVGSAAGSNVCRTVDDHESVAVRGVCAPRPGMTGVPVTVAVLVWVPVTGTKRATRHQYSDLSAEVDV